MDELRRIAIVDDDDADIEQLHSCITRYAGEQQLTLQVDVFRDGLRFIEGYQPVYDLVFMDVEMPLLDGMHAAKRLRERDEEVALIFVTRLAQYAVEGYTVAAMDFLVKPVRYGIFSEKLTHAASRIRKRRAQDKSIFINTGTDAMQKVPLRDILYVVKDRNYIRYVTVDGEIRARGTLKEVEESFRGSCVVQCAKGCLVNLRHIEQKVRSEISIAGMRFTITRPYQEAFTEAFMSFLRGAT